MKYIFFLFVLFTINLFPQHLPLQIGNQWHYNQGLVPTFPNAAFAVDTAQINNKLYFKIEYRAPNTDSLLWITYDRIEGDSNYFRLNNGLDKLLFNFAWHDGQVIVSPWSDDSTCFYIQIIHRDTTTIWGIHTEYYYPETGIFCPDISPDTAWVLSSYSYLRYFGCHDATDGLLIGAVINGITYGTLHPLPVELISFTAKVDVDEIHLEWETATEVNNRGFELYRKDSNSNSSYKLLKFISGFGTTLEPKNYSFVDENLSAGKYKYWLKQIDFDGSFEYSNTIEIEITAPFKYSLKQNYPNPFNPTTTIEFAIPNEQLIKLKIFDLLGNEIKVLVDGVTSAGNHSVEFNTSDFSSGVYIYQLQTRSQILSRKMMLLK